MGNPIILGNFPGTIYPGVTSHGSYDFFVAKLDKGTGQPIWVKGFGGPLSDYGASVACDGSGSVYVTGSFQGTVNFGGGNLVSAGQGDTFVMKLDASGAHVWSERFGDAADESGEAIAVDSAGTNVVVAGYYDGTPSFGGGALPAAMGDNVFVTKLQGGNGGHVWSKGLGGSGSSIPNDVALTPAGAVVLVGSYGASISLGGPSLPSGGGQNAFVAELSASGNHVWSHGYAAGANTQNASAVAIDPSGNVLFTGQMAGTLSFGGPMLTSGGGADVVLVKLDSMGNHVWSRRFGDGADQMGTGVVTDGSGNVALYGSFAGTLAFGSLPVTSAGTSDVFVAKLDPSGSTSYWVERFGSAMAEGAATIAIDGAGASFIAGFFPGSIVFGGTTLNSAGGDNVFAAKLAP